MGARKFDGLTADGHKTMSVDDLMSQVTIYQMNTGATDAEMLTVVSSCFAENARRWWQTANADINTMVEFETQLRIRFEQIRMDPTSQLLRFSNRKQGIGETLPTFIDEMCSLAANLTHKMEEDGVVQTIITNANVVCRGLLIAKSYETVNELRAYANYLGSVQLLPEPETKKKYDSKFPSYRPKTIHATEVIPLEKAASDGPIASDTQNSDQTVDVLAMALRQVSHEMKEITQELRKKDRTATPAVKKGEQNENSKEIYEDATEFACYGCGAPGVLQRNCQECKPKKNHTEFGCFGCNKPNVYRRHCPDCDDKKPKNE